MKKRREAEEPGEWKKQVLELCALLGLELKNEITSEMGLYSTNEIVEKWVLKRGRSYAQWPIGRKWQHTGPVEWGPAGVVVNDSRAYGKETDESCMKRLFEKLSGNELLVRGTDGRKPSPFGYTVTRTEQRIKLPEFGSVEELRLKLAAEGG